MLGAIIGDVIGSVHEGAGTKTKDFPLFVERTTFTDDSVLTVAVAEWILTGQNLVDLLHSYTHAYPGRGYGGMFRQWARRRVREPYNSFGNGAAMRVSPVGFAFETIEEVLAWSKRSAEEPTTTLKAFGEHKQLLPQSTSRVEFATRIRSDELSSHNSCTT